VDADVEQLLAIAASDGIRDLAELAVAADRAVVAVRAWKKHPSQDRYEVVVKLQKEIADNIPLPPKQTFVESLFKDPPKPKQHQGLQMLPYNTDVYEEEMLREVGYRVAETAAAEAAVLTNYAVERFGRATADALRPVFIGGAIAGGLYFLATAVFDRK
jgi:predicted TPR repeat methyltransferase